MKIFTTAIVLTAFVTPLAAQWAQYRTPGIPRTADGKPNLAGLWNMISPDTAVGNVAARKPGDLQPADIQPWAQALIQQRAEDFGVGNPHDKCLPDGPNYSTGGGTKRILQTPAMIVLLQEDLTYRVFHMDGRALEADANPSWMGYSVGHWDGDTLVVESNGFTERAWLDYDGHPHTEALRMTERYRRRDFGHLDVKVTFDDPGTYTRPWTVSVPLELFPDTELLEAVCRENEKSLAHIQVRTGSKEAAAVNVARALLSKYVGSYEIREQDEVTSAVVSLSGDTLFLDLDHTGPRKLVPISD